MVPTFNLNDLGTTQSYETISRSANGISVALAAPEPLSAALVLSGIAGLALTRRRQA